MVTPSLRLVRELGSGGMGRVWIADHLVLGQRVAVKFMAPELADEPGAVSRFSREAVAASEVRSEHVVQMLDHGLSDEGSPYLVMELLDGCDLATLLTRHRVLAPVKVTHVVTSIAKGLARAHERGVIHRDVKPSNVFLVGPESDRPLAKVLDFGIAKTASPDATATATGVSLGTVHYMSPEQVLAKPLDHRTDIWSLGVVAFEALTGTVPFDCASMGSLALALHTRPFPKPSMRAPSLGTAFDEWTQRACAREPADRFASMHEASGALTRALDASGPSRVVQVDDDARGLDVTVAGAVARESARDSGDCILPIPEPLIPLQRVRSTLVSSSLLALERRHLTDAYFGALPREYHDAVRSIVVGEWISLDVALAHYEAANGLGLSPLEMVAIGREVASRLSNPFVATLASMLSKGGVTPWLLFRQVQKAWARVYDGSAIGCWKVGEREARLEIHGWPLARIGYVRHGVRGIVMSTLEVLLRVKPYVQFLPALMNDTTIGFRVVWS